MEPRTSGQYVAPLQLLVLQCGASKVANVTLLKISPCISFDAFVSKLIVYLQISMSAGITLAACVSTRVRTPLAPTTALALLVSASLTMGSIVKVPDLFSMKKKLQCELRDFRGVEVKHKYSKPIIYVSSNLQILNQTLRLSDESRQVYPLPSFPLCNFPLLPDKRRT